jgi:predicted ATP-grasp superfamily ATP-dependent carboligase
MGPAFDPDRVTAGEMMDALIPFLEQRHRVVHIELLHPALDAQAMRERGFSNRSVPTYRAALTPQNPAKTFKAMRTSARRNVRRAERLNLVVRVERRDRFIDDHYQQLQQVYLRGGHSLPFAKDRLRECFRRMDAAGNLIPVEAYLPGGRASVATGMFLIEGRELLLWTWAHDPQYRWYRATEAMTWLAMQHAMNSGCETFDLMGRGQFKARLGASLDESKQRWIRSKGRWITAARDAAEVWYRGKHALKGRVARVTGQTPGTGRQRPDQVLACVLGDVDLVQALGAAGIPSAVMAPDGTPARFSRFVRHRLPWIDPWERPDDVVDQLLAYSATQPEPPALFYQDDATLLLVSRNRDKLRDAFRFVIPDPDLVERLVDKARFHQLAEQHGLPVPPTRVLYPSRESPPRHLRFPVLIKPVTRRPERWAAVGDGAKAVRVDDVEHLHRIWPALAAQDWMLLAQSLVPGPETSVESYHVYVDEDDNVTAEFTGRKIRTFPVAFGDSTALEITNAPDLQSLGREIVRTLQLRGVAKLDFKRGPDGQLYLLEVNPRFTLWHHLGARAGVNIPAMVYHDVRGQPRPEMSSPRVGARWCKPWSDRRAASAHAVPLHRWVPWALTSDALSAVTWKDPAPLFAAVLSRLFKHASHHKPSAGSHGVVAPSTTQ